MNNKEVIEVLRKVAKGIYPEDLDLLAGVCRLLSRTCVRWDLRRLLMEHVHEWPLFSGITTYPVPHPDYEDEPGDAFDDVENLWNDSEYGSNRRALCAWFADYLEEHGYE